MLIVELRGRRGKRGRAAALAVVALASVGHCARARNADTPLDAAFRSMYALDFASSEMHFAEYQRLHPLDPVGYAAESACVLFSELNRLRVLEAEFFVEDKRLFARPNILPDPQMKQRLFNLTARAQKIAEAKLGGDPSNEEGLFALALANGVLADYAALIEHRYWASLKFGKAGGDYAQKLLRANPKSFDAYVSTGVTQYIIGSLPAPVRWLGRLGGFSGNKEAGLSELRLAAEKGRYLKSYAKILLAVAYLRDNNRPAAAPLVAELAAEFPTNPLFVRQAKRLAAGSR